MTLRGSECNRGTGCGKTARPGLHGGRRVTGVPTVAAHTYVLLRGGHVMSRTKAFLSYSHQDEAWRDRLMTHLAVLERREWLHVWTDTRINIGEIWKTEID